MGARNHSKNKASSKILMSGVLSILLAIVSIALFSCDDEDKEKTLVSIEVTTPPSKTTYTLGEQFDPTGMVITATFSDKSTTTVNVTTAMLTIPPDFMATAGGKTITVAYAYNGVNQTTTFSVTVNPPEVTLQSIAVTTPPTKMTYTVGEAFDTAGMVVTATYSDNSTAPVTITADMLDYDFSTAGEDKTVTVSFTYKEVTRTANVTGIVVNQKAVSVGAQVGRMTAGVAGTVTFSVTTAHIANGAYTVSVANLPTGVTVQGQVTIAADNGTLTLAGSATTTAGATATLTLTIDGATSTVFTLTISEATDGDFCGGSGTSADPYLICTPAQLARLAELVNEWETNDDYGDNYYKLTADIDLSEYSASWNGGKGWIPIGNRDERFKGHFDGNNHKVSGLYINDNNLNFAGLFGYIIGGTVQNLGVEGKVTGRNEVGGVVGYIEGGITDCYTNVTVSGHIFVGGVVGYIEGDITNCHATGAVILDGSKAGGVAGEVFGNLSDCYATGTVSGDEMVGGVVGNVFGNVTNCYATGAVSGRITVGGVVGEIRNGGNITNCFSTGSVSSSLDQTGGVVGVAGSNSNVINCYATGAVSGRGLVGGIVGVNGGNIINCYATGAVSGMFNIGGVAGDVISVKNCAALNSSIARTEGTNTLFGRVAGQVGFWTTLSDNVAWSGMVALGGISFGAGAANNIEGADITAAQAKTQKTYEDLGWKFGNDDDKPWKMGVGDYGLPVFYWQTTAPAAMPEHLK